MSVWYVASNLTPGDSSGLDMVPNPGDYTDLETDDNCLVMHNDQMMIYSYDETDAQAGNGISIVVPDGNATGTGRWIIKDISTQGQNGFPIPLGPDSDSDISFVNGTRTFTIEPAVDEFSFIVQGVKFIRDAADTVVIADTHGLHWIYYDETGTLQSAVFADLTEDNLILYNCLVAYLYWDATNNEALLVGDERHGSSMSPATHYHLHETYGSQYETGLQLSAFSVDGSGAAAASAQFDVTEGEIHDEDIEVSIPTEENATIDTFYKSGPGGPWFKFAASAGYPVADGSIGTRLDWNDENGGDWQLVEVDSGKYVLTHYFATNNTGQPIIGIMGENQYTNIIDARAGAETELISLTTAGMPIIEYVAIATVIWQTNSSYSNQVAAIIRSTDTGDDYIDWRTTASLTGGGSSAVTHENLSGLLGGAALDHYHLTGAQHDTLTDGSTTTLHNHDQLLSSGGEDGVKVVNNAAVELYYNNLLALATTANGLSVFDTSGNDPYINLYTDASVQVGTIIGSATDFYIRGQNHGSNLRLQQEDAAGATSNILHGDPDGTVTLYYDNTIAFETTAGGINVQDTSGTDPIIILQDSSNNNLAKLTGQSGGNLVLQGWNGSSWESFFYGGQGAGLNLYYNGLIAAHTAADGFIVRDTSGTDAVIYWRSSSNVNQARLVGGAASCRFEMYTGAAWEDVWDVALNGAMSLYYNNIKEAETASGSFKATNGFSIAASSVMDNILDEDNMASNSATALCTQQSIKAYADSVGGGGGGGVGQNVIINGDMNVSQRATSFAPAVHGDYTLDRWATYFSGDTIATTITQDTDVPTFAQADHKSEYSLKIDCTTAEAAVAAGDNYYLTYAVEGNDISPYMGDELTFSYWIKSTKTGIYSVSFQNSAVDRSYIVEHEILVTDTWEKKTETFTLTDSGTWLADEGVGMYINFVMFCGTSAHGTADTWNATGDTSTVNQVNLLDNTANNVLISQVKLETGDSATQFVSRPFGEELALCQRYYEKSYSQGTYPGATTTVGQVLELSARNSATTTPGNRFNHTKCQVPTMVVYSPVTGASGKIANSGDKTGAAVNVGDSGWPHCSVTSGTAASAANYHWTAEAEL